MGEGGGIYCKNSYPTIQEGKLYSNSADDSGGGLFCDHSGPVLSHVNISYNSARQGGGINGSFSRPIFDSISRCNIYMNRAQEGSDLYSDTLLRVTVDTFTVLNPNEFHAAPFSHFSFDILHGYHQQSNADLFVSPAGDNFSSGLSSNEPLKTIHAALSFIQADSLHPHTIHLSEGKYSPSTNAEFFPVIPPGFVNIEGAGDTLTILNAGNTERVMLLRNNFSTEISGITLTGGSKSDGSGIYLNNSSPRLEDLIIEGNVAFGSCPYGWEIIPGKGGGILCENSNLTLNNLTVADNNAGKGGGIYCENSEPVINNVTITGNKVSCNNTWGCDGEGGGIYFIKSTAKLRNVLITSNFDLPLWDGVLYNGGGIFCILSALKVENATIAHNNYSEIRCDISELSVVNSIIWNNDTIGILGIANAGVRFSDISGGWSGEGNLNEDPLFVLSGPDSLALSPASPCIDAGTHDTTGLFLLPWDILRNHRIWDGNGDNITRIDMGAYEYGATSIGMKEPAISGKNGRFVCYPNPTNGLITLETPGISSKSQISILNLSGQEILEKTITESKTMVDISILPPGIYVVRLANDKTVETVKLIKQ